MLNTNLLKQSGVFFCQKGHFKSMIVSIGDVNVKGGVYPVWWVKIASGLP